MREQDRFRTGWRACRLVAALAAATAAATLAASPAAAAPSVQAHRGGTVVNGVPTYPENSMPAFRNAAADNFVIELDVKLSADGVPMVFHDGTLERATDCEGALPERTRAELADCRVDILGTEAKFRQLGGRDPRRAKIPTLRSVLRLLERTGARASVELANNPGQEGFDSSGAPARVMAEVIAASDVSDRKLIVQSFWPANLQQAREVLPAVAQSFLTLAQSNSAGPSIADSLEAEWFSPNWPVDEADIEESHSLGQRVVPYTLDTRADIADAVRLDVDAIITNDPTLARRVIRRAAG